MKLEVIQEKLTVCQVASYAGVDLTKPFTFPACTDEENSLVCPTACVPQSTLRREDGWRAFRIAGVLDFGLIGILARIATLLADSKIGIFVLSTYNTDYVLVKEDNLENALCVLENAGYTIQV